MLYYHDISLKISVWAQSSAENKQLFVPLSRWGWQFLFIHLPLQVIKYTKPPSSKKQVCYVGSNQYSVFFRIHKPPLFFFFRWSGDLKKHVSNQHISFKDRTHSEESIKIPHVWKFSKWGSLASVAVCQCAFSALAFIGAVR